MDDVGRDGADLDEAVVLDEDGVARQVAVDDGRLRPLKMTMTQGQSQSVTCQYMVNLAGQTDIYVQGDQAAWTKPPVDIDLKLHFSIGSLY